MESRATSAGAAVGPGLARKLGAPGEWRAPVGALADAGAAWVCAPTAGPPAAYALAAPDTGLRALARFVHAARAAECLPWIVWLQLDAGPWDPLIALFDLADAIGAGLAISWGGPMLALRHPRVG